MATLSSSAFQAKISKQQEKAGKWSVKSGKRSAKAGIWSESQENGRDKA
jgi:hypothetical protein